MKKTICYFGIYNPDFGRSRIYLRGFKENGVEVLECRDVSSGILKYIRLFLKHWKIRDNYDYLIVGYSGYIVVWFAKLISKKPVVFDALCTMYEGNILVRKQSGILGTRELYVKFIDWLAVKCADVVLVESQNQRKYFEKKYGKSQKYKVIYTGADNSIYFKDDGIAKRGKFTVVFRGKFLPEAGIKYVIEAADLLKDKGVDLLIIGNGFLVKEAKQQIESLNLKNLEWISQDLSNKEMREKILTCHVSLGQFENHDRLQRTIPHKCYESLAMGLPYITAHMPAVMEILKNGENCLFVNPADPKDLADKILELKNNTQMAKNIAKNGLALYESNFTPRILTKQILELL